MEKQNDGWPIIKNYWMGLDPLDQLIELITFFQILADSQEFHLE